MGVGGITFISTAVSHANVEMKPFVLEQYLPSEPIVPIDVHILSCFVSIGSTEMLGLNNLLTRHQVDPIVIEMEPLRSHLLCVLFHQDPRD